MRPQNLIVLTPDCLRSADSDLLTGIEKRTDIFVDECYAAGTWTIPSHATLLSATAAYQHDVARRGKRFRDSLSTIPKAAREAGYTSALISENATFTTEKGFGGEMDIVDEDIHLKRFRSRLSPAQDISEKSASAALTSARHALLSNQPWKNLANVISGIYEKRRDPPLTEFPHHGKQVLAHLSGWLEDTDRLFSIANILDTHNPHYCPPDFKSENLAEISRTEVEALEVADDNRGYVFGEELPDKALSTFSSWDGVQERMHDVYRSQIAYTDRIISDWLDANELDDALIVIIGDHGQLFGAEGMVGHQTSLHPHGVAVPAFVSVPSSWSEDAEGSSPLSMVGLARAIKATINEEVTDTAQFLEVWSETPIITCVDGPTWNVDELHASYGKDHPALSNLEVRKIGLVEGDKQTVHTSPWSSAEITQSTYRIEAEDRQAIEAEPLTLNDTQREWLKKEVSSTPSVEVSKRLKTLGYR